MTFRTDVRNVGHIGTDVDWLLGLSFRNGTGRRGRLDLRDFAVVIQTTLCGGGEI